MSQEANILYIPIQINGGEEGEKSAPNKLLDRELYVLKDGKLYVGIEENGAVIPTVIAGRVVPEAIIESPTITKMLKFGKDIVMTPKEFTDNQNSLTQEGRVVFINEGTYTPSTSN